MESTTHHIHGAVIDSIDIPLGGCVAGERRWKIRSPYQSADTLVRVVAPERQSTAGRFLFVLPVEAGYGHNAIYGDGLKSLVEIDAHNRLGFTLVAPTFSTLPWYADHTSHPGLRQESHLLRVVLPFVERLYPRKANAPHPMTLLGFSKSGWGAWSLLMRHPDLFTSAVAWDAPFTLAQPDRWGTEELFADQSHFDAHRPDLLAPRVAAVLGSSPRLAMLGYGNFREHHLAMHGILNSVRIAHHHVDGPWREHSWHSGWLEQAVQFAHVMTPAV